MTYTLWALWALFLIAQNFAFTFVSRARNSGSLYKHMVAGVFSNGIWFIGQIFAVGVFMKILSGAYGMKAALGAGLFYTTFTLTGSLLAHYYALLTEKGTSRVGAHKNLASFTKEEGDMIRQRALFVDTGDGLGTFTVDELDALKRLIGTDKTETTKVVDELINYSSPKGVNTTTRDADATIPTDLYTDEEVKDALKNEYAKALDGFETLSHDIPGTAVQTSKFHSTKVWG